MVEIALGSNCMQALPKIVSKLKSISLIKQSETKNILILAKFKNTKTRTAGSNCDSLISNLIRVIDPIDSQYFPKDFSMKSNKKIRSFMRKKIAKKVFNHVGYLRSSVEGLKHANVSDPLLAAKAHLYKCLEPSN